jgi:hypothetical protein
VKFFAKAPTTVASKGRLELVPRKNIYNESDEFLVWPSVLKLTTGPLLQRTTPVEKKVSFASPTSVRFFHNHVF